MRARRTDLALLLHMHQPLYVHPRSGRAELPWVRLHAGRGYLDVAALLARHPTVGATVNFVPSLLEQLAAAAAGGSDAYLELARRPTFTPEERELLLKRFFSLHWARLVEPRPRYRELLEKRGRRPSPAELAARAREFSDRELRDLTVLFHLAWLGFAIRQREPHREVLATLERKGRDYTLDDLEAVLAVGRAACALVLPLYRELAGRGQIELSSSPYYHPIVPLLVDSEAARRAQPQASLPERFAWPEDAQAQIALGREAHARTFGRPPRGMWPPEGCLSPEAVAAYRAEGVTWLASCEGNLWPSLGGDGTVRRRGELYRPYRHQGMDLVFRDRELSDRIGFRYQSLPTDEAVGDLLARVREAGEQGAAHVGGGAPALVGLFLDGENPWEAYPGDGEPFLEGLCVALEGAADLKAVTVGDHLAEHGARGELRRLHSGSWIDADFHIWIADPVKNRAWEMLGRARRALAGRLGLSDERAMQARRHLLAAEGSDWFWWFGEPFHSTEDALYDQLFRAHLEAAWRAMGENPPSEVFEPVARPDDRHEVRPPRAPIGPFVDGRVNSYFEWVEAGRYDVPRGSTMAETPLVGALHFGLDRRTLYLRLDPIPGQRGRLRSARLEITLRAGEQEVRLEAGLDEKQLRLDHPATPPATLGAIANSEIIELAVPFCGLPFADGATLGLVVRLREAGVVVGRYPREGEIAVRVPDDHFAAEHWVV